MNCVAFEKWLFFCGYFSIKCLFKTLILYCYCQDWIRLCTFHQIPSSMAGLQPQIERQKERSFSSSWLCSHGYSTVSSLHLAFINCVYSSRLSSNVKFSENITTKTSSLKGTICRSTYVTRANTHYVWGSALSALHTSAHLSSWTAPGGRY
jgi:hypothetical protein